MQLNWQSRDFGYNPPKWMSLINFDIGRKYNILLNKHLNDN